MKKSFFFSPVAFLICLVIAFSAASAEAQSEKIRVAISSISTSQVNVWVPLDAGFLKNPGSTWNWFISAERLSAPQP
jgi:hypothetical protein